MTRVLVPLAQGCEELEAVTDLFHYNKDKPVVPKNAARHSGSIKWVRGLVERVEAPMEKIRMLNKLVLDTEEARTIFASHAALVQAMKEFEGQHVQAWVSQVSQVCLRPAERCMWSHPAQGTVSPWLRYRPRAGSSIWLHE